MDATRKRKNAGDAPAKAVPKKKKALDAPAPAPSDTKVAANKKAGKIKANPGAAKSPRPPAEEERFDDVPGAATSQLDVTQVGKSVRALLTHVAREAGGLLDNDAPVHVLLSTKHMPKPVGKARACKPVALALQHPYVDLDTAEICLITKDPQREFKDKLAAQGLRNIKVIGVSKLKKKYHPYEAKRELCKAHEVFLADARILPMLPPLLGKTFFEKRRLPISVDLKKSDLRKELERAACGAHFRHAVGTSNSVQLGTTTQPPKHIVANIVSGVEQLVAKLPGKWTNVQSLQLRTTNSVALPFYNALPNA